MFQSITDHEIDVQYTVPVLPNNSSKSKSPTCIISKTCLVTLTKEGLVKEMNYDMVDEKFTINLQKEIQLNSNFHKQLSVILINYHYLHRYMLS